jgi:hypothetical protein
MIGLGDQVLSLFWSLEFKYVEREKPNKGTSQVSKCSGTWYRHHRRHHHTTPRYLVLPRHHCHFGSSIAYHLLHQPVDFPRFSSLLCLSFIFITVSPYSLTFQQFQTFRYALTSPSPKSETHLIHPDIRLPADPPYHSIWASESLPSTPSIFRPPFSISLRISISVSSSAFFFLFFFHLLPTARAIPRLLFPPHPVCSMKLTSTK